MRNLLILCATAIILLLVGCQEPGPDKQNTKSTPTATPQTAKAADEISTVKVVPKTSALFDEPVEPVVVELPSEALPYWRDAAQGDGKPAFVLFSIHPLLQPIEPELTGEVAELMQSGSSDSFRLHGSLYRAEPLILPTQTLSAAIDAGLFSEILWVFPSTETKQDLQLELFRQQMTDADFITEAEGKTLTLKNGVFSGTVRSLPYRAVPAEALQRINKPLVMHIDLGYFKGLYLNEVKTRIYSLLHDTALAIDDIGWQPQLVTLSYSTEEGTFPLDVRFLISNFAEMLRDPSLLTGNLPDSWALRSEALYAANFFLESKVKDYYEQAAEQFPGDAAAQYDMYRHLFFEQNKFDAALSYLDKAATIDKGYLAAYLELALVAEKKQNLPAAIDMLNRATEMASVNPMIDLYRAQYMIQADQAEQALPIIKRLQQISWSKRYHPDVPGLLGEMTKMAGKKTD